MSYQVIARKYRPQRFEDVVGQEHVTTTLANAIRAGRIAHAYLFCGPRGTGKTTIARIFAKCLNCTNGPRVDFDDADPRCVEIAEGRSLDVLEIDGASNNGVEQVRELRETCRFSPAAARFKIYIIDEVHMLTVAAFNALLKTLEEPPPHVKFLFATTDPEKVLPTILSRCQRFDLRRIPAALIVKHLAAIAAREGVRVEEAALHAIARGADGGLRDAESTLDQLISFCGPEIVEADVLSMFGLAARDQVLALAEAVLAGDAAGILRRLEELARGGKDLGRLLADLLHHFRNLLIYLVAQADSSLLEVSEAELEAIQRQATGTPADAVTRIMEVLTDTEVKLRDAMSKKVALEVALLQAAQARQAVSLDTVLARLHALRHQTESVSPPWEKPPSSATSGSCVAGADTTASTGSPSVLREDTVPSRPARESEALAPSPARTPSELPPGTSPALAALWTAVLEAARQNSQFLYNHLLKAFPAKLERQTLVIGFPPEHARLIALVDNARNRDLLLGVLRSRGLRDSQLKFLQAEPPAIPPPQPTAETPLPEPGEPPPDTSAPYANDSASPAAAVSSSAAASARPAKTSLIPVDPAQFKNDPLIQAALEVFKGRIAKVLAPAARQPQSPP